MPLEEVIMPSAGSSPELRQLGFSVWVVPSPATEPQKFHLESLGCGALGDADSYGQQGQMKSFICKCGRVRQPVLI